MPLYELSEPGVKKAMMGGKIGEGGVWKPTHKEVISLLYDVVGEPTKLATDKELAAQAARNIAAIHKRQGTKPKRYQKLLMGKPMDK
jgi:hypothetical protein